MMDRELNVAHTAFHIYIYEMLGLRIAQVMAWNMQMSARVKITNVEMSHSGNAICMWKERKLCWQIPAQF